MPALLVLAVVVVGGDLWRAIMAWLDFFSPTVVPWRLLCYILFCEGDFFYFLKGIVELCFYSINT